MNNVILNTNDSVEIKTKINCVVLGTDIAHSRQYVLSLDDKEIIFPYLYVNLNNKKNIESAIIDMLKSHIFISELELMPQIISLNTNHIVADDNEINTVYGFVVKHTSNLNKAYWIPFHYSEPNQYSNLIFEVIQKLR